MPFVTETLWAALPHGPDDPELLIVARWPAVTPGARDEAAERDVTAVIELVRAVRNARAEAGIPAGAWLAADLAVPPELGPAVDALQPAISRLARARPLVVHASRDSLGGSGVGSATGLAVIAGALEAFVARPAGGIDVTDRARVERELAEAEAFLSAARARLANEAFTSRAPAAVVAGARARAAELADQVDRLRSRLQR